MYSSSPPDPSDESPVSLDTLAEAFAQVMGGSAGRASALPEAPAESREPAPSDTVVRPPEGPWAAPQPAGGAAAGPDQDPCELSPLTILEAMLFVGCPGDVPLAAHRAAELMRGVESSEIADLVAELNRRYAAGGCPYHIVTEGDGYRLALRPEFFALRDAFHGRTREAKLSQAAVDVLAIVAYRQPITADEVTSLRGTASGAILNQLVRRRLLRIERPADQPRPAVYFTTERFLRLFGLTSLADLPQSEDID
jgi:segregation and condensation protein B